METLLKTILKAGEGMAKEDVLAIMDVAAKLSYLEWIKVSEAVEVAFKEKERQSRSSLKLDNTQRIKYFYRIP